MIIDNDTAPTGTVVRTGARVHVVLSVGAGTAERDYQVAIEATVDNTATTDMTSTATESVVAPGTPAATARTGMTVGLDRPSVYVHLDHSLSVRAGHHRQISGVVGNSATMTTRTATLWITLPAHTSLSTKWGVDFDNRRMRCTGSGRHYRCTVTGMHASGVSGLLIDVRAAKHAPHGYAGRLSIVGEPTGYDNGAAQNHASARVTVRR